MAVDVIAIDLGLDLRHVKVRILHALAAFEDHRRANQIQAVLMSAEPRANFRFKGRLCPLERFVQNDEHLRLKGKGLPPLHGGARGSQLLRVVVEIPKKPGKRAKKLYEELLGLEEHGA